MSYRSRLYNQRNPQSKEGMDKPFFAKKHQSADIQKKDAFFQAKLAVNEPGDKYEQEADSVADKVVAKPVATTEKPVIHRLSTTKDEEKPATNDARMAQDKRMADKPLTQTDDHQKEKEKPIQKKDNPKKEEEKKLAQKMGSPEKKKEEGMQPAVQKMELPEKKMEEGAPSPVQKKSDEKEKDKVQKKDDPLKEKEKKSATTVQAKPESGGNTASPKVATSLKNTAGKGNALPPKTMQEMSTSFGVDFSNVNIHEDAEAAKISDELNAQAFTHGNDIYFNQGKFNPQNAEGKHLLAHELTHTIQQGNIQKSPAPVQLDPNDTAIPLDQRYTAALQANDWKAAAELLNGFNRDDIAARLAQLNADQVINMHQGAVDNPTVGPDSNVAQMTKPGTPPASMVPVPATQVTSLDQKYKAALQANDWQLAAELLNAFSRDDISNRLTTPDVTANLHQGALDNPRVGPTSNVAQMTLPIPTGGAYEDYATDPNYVDNFNEAAYDPFSNTLHLFFSDGGEAVMLLPLEGGGGNRLLVFEKKSFLNSPGPQDIKTYPSIHSKENLPVTAQWLNTHAEEIQQSGLLLQAGTGTLTARSLPPNLWWLALLAPAAGLGAKFTASRMRPAFEGPEPAAGELPIIKAPAKGSGRSGAVTEPNGLPSVGAAAATKRPFLTAAQIKNFRANGVKVLTFRSFDADVVQNQKIIPTGQTNVNAPDYVFFGEGFRGFGYGPQYLIIEQEAVSPLYPNPNSPGEWFTTSEIPADKGYWSTSEEVTKGLSKKE